jgi:hypothetical protein
VKVSELRPCDNCAGPIAPTFYVVRFSQAIINAAAVNEFMGMHQFFQGKASAALVENFAPAAGDAALVFGDKDKTLETELFVCQRCVLAGPIDLAMLQERRNHQTKSV